MAEVYRNNAWTSLSADLNAGDLTCDVDNSAPFEPLAGGEWFRVSMWNEVIKVTAIAGTTWTIERELEGVMASVTPIGTALIHQPTAGMFSSFAAGGDPFAGGFYEPLTVIDADIPQLLFNADGDVISVFAAL